MKTLTRSVVSLCGAAALAMVAICAAGAGKEDSAAHGTVESKLPASFGTVIVGVAYVEAVEPNPQAKAPRRSVAIVFRSVDGKLLGAPVSLSAEAFDRDAQQILQEWSADGSARDERTVYGYEILRMEGLPDGISRLAALRDHPLPAGPAFDTRHVFVLMAVGSKLEPGKPEPTTGPAASRVVSNDELGLLRGTWVVESSTGKPDEGTVFARMLGKNVTISDGKLWAMPGVRS